LFYYKSPMNIIQSKAQNRCWQKCAQYQDFRCMQHS
jgi:hypothetical protein